MRRALSILFVLLFGLAPLAASFDGDDASLPACCRRHGAHHCAMVDAALVRMVQSALRTPAFKAPSRCPQCPLHGNAAPSHSLAVSHAPQSPAAPIRRILPLAPCSANANSIYLATPSLRGPPALA